MLIHPPTKQLPLVVTQYLFHDSSTGQHTQLRPEFATILTLLGCPGTVTSRNIRLYQDSDTSSLKSVCTLHESKVRAVKDHNKMLEVN